MKHRIIRSLTTTLVTAALSLPVYAVQKPHSHPGSPDDRILHHHYVEGEVYHVDVNLRYSTLIQFERGETISSITTGDSESFQISRLKRGDFITVKPLIPNARTNMNVLTSKNRIYTFYLNAVSDGRQTGQNFRLSFQYKPDPAAKKTFVSQTSGTQATGSRLNAGYQVQGTTDFIPIEVYDDGVNTWLRYTSTARRPAVFKTDKQGRESVANFTAHPNHRIQIHGLSDNWTLRIGDEIVCIRKVPRGAKPRTASSRARTTNEQSPVIVKLVQP